MKKIQEKELSIANAILSGAFYNNKSVNYILKMKNEKVLISKLMDYSIAKAKLYGEVWLNDLNNACCILLDPTQTKKNFLYSLWLDILLIKNVVGLHNLKKVIYKEKITQMHLPQNIDYIHLWFIGVDVNSQGNGIGSAFMNEIINYYSGKKQAICLETSTIINLPFYEKFGFKIYHEEDFGFRFYFLIKYL
ncbi:GNAT family N-acetyltransferase [uncultured Chryseobacterium sp.]|uniref:GNAT family N-acetyltransferase n=1 Tax=uncultured Chryseobacterium sp. TaxID=259322 RepID=UPI00258648A7|nr:GNAT family N-acetyltransferase [uncultured Chryseobacterium sp.]